MKQLQRKIHTGATNDKYVWSNVALVDTNEGDELRVVYCHWVSDESSTLTESDYDKMVKAITREPSEALNKALSFEPSHITAMFETMADLTSEKPAFSSDIEEAMERR